MEGASKDVLFLIFSRLSARDVLALGATSRRMNAESKTVALWRRLLERDFHKKSPNPRQAYREHYHFRRKHPKGCVHFRYYSCVDAACSQNDAISLKLLLSDPPFNTDDDKDDALGSICYDKQYDLVRTLIDNDLVSCSDALCRAAENGWFKVVKELLQDERTDPTARRSFSIRFAARRGFERTVRLLLKDGRADPCAENHYALERAADNEHERVVKLLLSDPRVAATMPERFFGRARECIERVQKKRKFF